MRGTEPGRMAFVPHVGAHDAARRRRRRSTAHVRRSCARRRGLAVAQADAAPALIDEDAWGNIAAPLLTTALILAAFSVPYLLDSYKDRRRDVDERGMVEIRDAGAKGLGAFSSAFIRHGRFIGTYRGDHLDVEGVNERYPQGDAVYLWRVHDGLYVDAGNPAVGNFTRYMNHISKGKATVEAHVDRRRKCVDFYAARDIAAGEELRFDYGEEYWSKSDPSEIVED